MSNPVLPPGTDLVWSGTIPSTENIVQWQKWIVHIKYRDFDERYPDTWDDLQVSINVEDTTVPVFKQSPVNSDPAQNKEYGISELSDNYSSSDKLSVRYGIVDSELDCTKDSGLIILTPEKKDWKRIVSLGEEKYNGKYLCWRLADEEGNVTIAISSQIGGIDMTIPTVPERLPNQRVRRNRELVVEVLTGSDNGKEIKASVIRGCEDGLECSLSNGILTFKSSKRGIFPLLVDYVDVAWNVASREFTVTVYVFSGSESSGSDSISVGSASTEVISNSETNSSSESMDVKIVNEEQKWA